MMSDEIKRVLHDKFPETPDIRVQIVWDPPWTPEMMSEEARNRLGIG
jgi:metal-sulfur cluster biosynthetic enzyme